MSSTARPTHRVKEQQSGLESFTLVDELGVAVPASALTTATLTLSMIPTGTIVNNRNGQNVLNANNVTIDGQGVVTWAVQPADMAILDDTRRLEVHRALFIFTWGQNKQLPFEIDFEIENLSKLT